MFKSPWLKHLQMGLKQYKSDMNTEKYFIYLKCVIFSPKLLIGDSLIYGKRKKICNPFPYGDIGDEVVCPQVRWSTPFLLSFHKVFRPQGKSQILRSNIEAFFLILHWHLKFMKKVNNLKHLHSSRNLGNYFSEKNWKRFF